MFGLRGQELIVILLLVLVLFGSSKIPEMMKGFGRGIKEFKKGMRDDEDPPKEEEKKKEVIADASAAGPGTDDKRPA